MKKLVFLLLIYSCKSKHEARIDKNIEKVDSMLQKSQKLNDSSNMVLQLADSTTSVLINNTIIKYNEIKKNKNSLIKTKTITIRDTIYITEKKNFWGRKKIIKDSVSSQTIQDTTTNDY